MVGDALSDTAGKTSSGCQLAGPPASDVCARPRYKGGTAESARSLPTQYVPPFRKTVWPPPPAPRRLAVAWTRPALVGARVPLAWLAPDRLRSSNLAAYFRAGPRRHADSAAARGCRCAHHHLHWTCLTSNLVFDLISCGYFTAPGAEHGAQRDCISSNAILACNTFNGPAPRSQGCEG